MQKSQIVKQMTLNSGFKMLGLKSEYPYQKRETMGDEYKATHENAKLAKEKLEEWFDCEAKIVYLQEGDRFEVKSEKQGKKLSLEFRKKSKYEPWVLTSNNIRVRTCYPNDLFEEFCNDCKEYIEKLEDRIDNLENLIEQVIIISNENELVPKRGIRNLTNQDVQQVKQHLKDKLDCETEIIHFNKDEEFKIECRVSPYLKMEVNCCINSNGSNEEWEIEVPDFEALSVVCIHDGLGQALKEFQSKCAHYSKELDKWAGDKS